VSELRTATEIAAALRARRVSAVEIANDYLRRIQAQDAQLGAFLSVDPERTLEEARAAQERLDQGAASPLTGIPFAVKDNISTAGRPTTCASKILEGYVPPFDATVAKLLARQACPLLGKTNLDEFAMGASTENSAFQATRNPWDLERSPGGSSGGSAAAVAAGLAPLALGSDTGGSIRQPAALCGVVGFKPTYGRCSRYGLVAFGSSLDQIGPIGLTVADVALAAAATTGHDRRDATSLPHPAIDPHDLEEGSLKGKRLALPSEMFDEGISEGVRTRIEEAIRLLEKAGAEVIPVSLPSIRYGVSTYYIIAPAEASSNLARFDGIRYGPREEGSGHIEVVERTRARRFGHEVKTRIMIGTYALSAGYYDAYYLRAQQVRSLMRAEFQRVFAEYDAVIGPTTPTTAFRLGELIGDPMALKLADFCTIPANMGGFPAISLPAGLWEGLPVGVQLMAPALADEALLQLARSVERELPPRVDAPFGRG
jgi:aspartyl-tRNA(Asn)/glutamyl-tRNA(Gln) amidotransferase subunit A